MIKETPNVPVVHEFRALALFALKRYDEAAAVEYAVLTAGPGWNWSTLVGLYPDVDTYTRQLRDLEAYVTANPSSPSGRFLLADHYMVEGHNDEALAIRAGHSAPAQRPALGVVRQGAPEARDSRDPGRRHDAGPGARAAPNLSPCIHANALRSGDGAGRDKSASTSASRHGRNVEISAHA